MTSKRIGREVVIVPTVDPAHVTPHTEAFQADRMALSRLPPRVNSSADKIGAVRCCWRVLTKRAVFLDREGVINPAVIRNGRSYPPPSLDQFEFLPGVADHPC